MPIYEYRCKSCEHTFEVFAKMSDPAPDSCPECAGGQIEKVLHPVSVHYKGSGFYSTDYAIKGTSKAGKGGEKSSTSSEKSSSGSSGESGSSKDSGSGGSDKGSSTKSSSSSKSSD